MVDRPAIVLICIDVSVCLEDRQFCRTHHLRTCFWFAARDQMQLCCSGSWAFAVASHPLPQPPPFGPVANNVTVRSFARQKMVPSHLVCGKKSWHQPSLPQPVAFQVPMEGVMHPHQLHKLAFFDRRTISVSPKRNQGTGLWQV